MAIKIKKIASNLARNLVVVVSVIISVLFVFSGVGVVGAHPISQQNALSRQSPQLGTHIECRVLSTVVNTTYLWTPVILLNSPYGGSASGSDSTYLYSQYTYSAGPVSLSSKTSQVATVQVSDSNGAASGAFELYKWVSYQTQDYAVIGDGLNQYCTQPYLSEISGNSLGLTFQGILPQGTTSDAKEPTNLSIYDGHNFVTFNNGYTANNYPISTCGATGSYQVTQSTLETISVSIKISVSGSYYTVSGNMGMLYGSGSSTSFTYNFPSYGYWDTTELSGSIGGALAFSYVGDNSGC